jgi:NHLM bacteriocin system ABC transporter peptidase/ATP-binding protein
MLTVTENQTEPKLSPPRRKVRVKTPTLLQMEATECGAASLGIILAFFGKHVPLEQLRIDAGISRDGSKALNVVKAARKHGLTAKAFSLANIEDLYSVKLPAIVFWRFSHFLVLEGFDRKYFYLNDPASGHRRVTYQDFSESFTGVILTFEPNAEFIKVGKTRSLAGGLWMRLASSKIPLAYVTLTGLLLLIPGLLIPIFAKVFVDYFLIERVSGWIIPLLIGMLGTAAVQGTLTWLQRNYLLRMETRIAVSESSKFFRHVLRLPLEFFYQRYTGDIAGRVQSNDRLAMTISNQLTTAFLNLVLVTFYVGLMLYYDLILTGVALVAVALNMMAMVFNFRKMADISMLQMQERGKLTGYAANGLYNIETIKSTGMESDFFADWSGLLAKTKSTQVRLNVFMQRLLLINPVLALLSTAVILGVGSLRVMHGSLTIGTLVAFQALTTSFLNPVQQIINLVSNIQNVKGDMARLDDVMEYAEDASVSSPVSTASPPAQNGKLKLDGYVEIKNVSFGYSRLEAPLIESFHLSLKPGSRVALVGKSGSGKSTISRLVMGLYQPWKGEVLFDNSSRQEVPREILANSVSLVDQDIFLFQGTVHDNLTMWNPLIPDADIIRAAEDSCIHDVIATRPGGYNSLVAESGANFSGGERQRLEIARALVNNPTIVVLDEATSALDAVTEKTVDDNLRRRGCTCIIVAHRLSTIRDCDEIIVLDRGKVAQRGTHEELKDVDGIYKDLISTGKI